MTLELHASAKRCTSAIKKARAKTASSLTEHLNLLLDGHRGVSFARARTAQVHPQGRHVIGQLRQAALERDFQMILAESDDIQNAERRFTQRLEDFDDRARGHAAAGQLGADVLGGDDARRVEMLERQRHEAEDALTFQAAGRVLLQGLERGFADAVGVPVALQLQWRDIEASLQRVQRLERLYVARGSRIRVSRFDGRSEHFYRSAK